MYYYLNYFNGSKEYQSGIRFMLRHIFKEYSTPSKADWRWSSIDSNFNLAISANNGLELNGVDGDKVEYYLDDKVNLPTIFITSLPKNIVVHSKNKKYLIMSSYPNDDESTIYFPTICLKYMEFLSKGYLFNRPKYILPYKKKFLAYNECQKAYHRENFMEILLTKASPNILRGIYCLGDCKNHACANKKINNADPKAKMEEYSNYHFVLAMECVKKVGYLTENILEILLAGSIPIYWGDKDLAKRIFNPKAFVCVDDFETPEKCINYILSMSSIDLQKMKKERMFVGGKLPNLFNIMDKSNESVYLEIKQKIRALVGV